MSVYEIWDEKTGDEETGNKEYVDTEKAARIYTGQIYTDDTGSYSENLYKSSRGRWYLLNCSRLEGEEGEGGTARWVTDREAALWLLLRNIQVPSELMTLADQVAE